MLEHNLDQLDAWLTHTLERLTPAAQKKKLLRKVGLDLRRTTARRIAAQQSPEGDAWPARKPQPRKKNHRPRQKMMQKLRHTRHLRLRVEQDSLRLGWTGSAGRLARIHHYGLRQKLAYGVAQYPARELIGLAAGDEQLVRDSILKHLESGA